MTTLIALITLLNLSVRSYDYSSEFPCEGLGMENFKESQITSFSSEVIHGEHSAYHVVINSCEFVLSIEDQEFMNVEKI